MTPPPNRPPRDIDALRFFTEWLPREFGSEFGPGKRAASDITVAVNLVGDGGGHWILDVKDGVLSVRQPGQPGPDPVVTMRQTVDDWRAVAVGEEGAIDLAPPQASPLDVLFVDPASRQVMAAVKRDCALRGHGLPRADLVDAGEVRTAGRGGAAGRDHRRRRGDLLEDAGAQAGAARGVLLGEDPAQGRHLAGHAARDGHAAAVHRQLMFVSRREFVRGTIAGGAAVASGMIVVGCGNDVEPAPLIDATVNETDGTITLDRRRYPDLMPDGGALTIRLKNSFSATTAVLLIHRPGNLDQDGQAIIALDPGADYYSALDSACPHAGCPLGYSKKDRLVECPCHGSRFQAVAADGICTTQVRHLPAKQGPRTYGVQLSGDTITISSGANAATAQARVLSGKITLAVADFPMLADPGGSVVFDCGQIAGFADPIVVIRKDAATVAALDGRCTHTGCTVAYQSNRGDLECPCHGSTYDLGGKVLVGPATKAITAFPTTFDGTTIVITVA